MLASALRSVPLKNESGLCLTLGDQRGVTARNGPYLIFRNSAGPKGAFVCPFRAVISYEPSRIQRQRRSNRSHGIWSEPLTRRIMRSSTASRIQAAVAGFRRLTEAIDTTRPGGSHGHAKCSGVSPSSSSGERTRAGTGGQSTI
jgi:hypothetical protein